MKPLIVELGNRSYPIHIEAGLLRDEALCRRSIGSDQVMIVSNDKVAPLYLDRLRRHFGDRECETLVLPDGERYKTLDSVNEIITALLAWRFDRGCVLVALGGGVIGDVTGFAAACYQRGVDYVQVPTSLLAQVDASVGGKTGVNHALGKNMIGAFHQPAAVLADTATLETLDDRDFRAGIAEVIKYGLIRDPEFFRWLEQNIAGLLEREPQVLAQAIRRSCENKATVVAEDEREAGTRAILNLGHTFGHAIENVLGYGTWLHGEAVAAGMCMASALSVRLGWISSDEHARVLSLVTRSGLPAWAPDAIEAGAIMHAMAVDKKSRGGRVRLVLLRGIGSACVSQDYDDDALHEILSRRPDP